MAVVNVPANAQIYSLGRITGALHIYNIGNPPGTTHYNITIVTIGNWNHVPVAPGHSNTYHPAGNAVYLQNMGPSVLQVLYVDQAVAPEEAGLDVVGEMPAHTVDKNA